MNAQDPAGNTAIYVYTKHPLVFLGIQTCLSPAPQSIRLLPDIMALRFEKRLWVVILDIHSISKWPAIASQCQVLGGRSIIIVPGTLDREQEKRMLYLGVHGIVGMARFWTDLPLAVRAVSEGRLWISRETLESYAKAKGPSGSIEDFTAREQQILELLLSGCTNKEIANALRISDRTAKFHVSNILRKSNVESRKALRSSHAGESASSSQRGDKAAFSSVGEDLYFFAKHRTGS